MIMEQGERPNKADLAQKLESSCPDTSTELPQMSPSTSSAYIIDGMAMMYLNHRMRSSSEYSRI